MTSCVRIAAATSTPSTVIVGSCGSVPDAITGSVGERRDQGVVGDVDVVVEHPRVIARNWAPVSR